MGVVHYYRYINDLLNVLSAQLLILVAGIVSEVQLSSLSTLVAVVTHLGPVLPSLPAELLRWFPSELLSSSPPPPPPIAKLALDLLGACTASTNPSLTLPLNSAIHTFTMYGTHQDLKVKIE